MCTNRAPNLRLTKGNHGDPETREESGTRAEVHVPYKRENLMGEKKRKKNHSHEKEWIYEAKAAEARLEAF